MKSKLVWGLCVWVSLGLSAQVKVNNHFSEAEQFFQEKKYQEALTAFEKCNVNLLNETQQHAFYFESGCCAMQLDDYVKAASFFALAKEFTGKYTEESIYRYAQCLYANRDYTAAKDQFESLPEHSKYATDIPYYFANIYYQKEDYAASIVACDNYLNDNEASDSVRTLAIKHIKGLSLYEEGKFREALVLLNEYVQHTTLASRKDIFCLGVCYYHLNLYQEAIGRLKDVTTIPDGLAQNAYLFLGHCALQQDFKKEALANYQEAAKMRFNTVIKEEASYHCIKLNYAFAPLGNQNLLNDFQTYFATYPPSLHAEELNELLIQYLYKNKKYETAYQLILRTSKPSETIQKIMQETAYWVATGLYQKKAFEEAVKCYSKSLAYGIYSNNLQALALYWRAESYYQLANNANAMMDYKAFLAQPDAPQTEVYSMGYYSLAYCQFKEKNELDASANFQRFIVLSAQNDSLKVANSDAYNRLGDCAFMQNKLEDALQDYNHVINRNGYGIDHALFQRAFIYGLTNNEQKKIAELHSLIEKYPQSIYVIQAQKEIEIMNNAQIIKNEREN